MTYRAAPDYIIGELGRYAKEKKMSLQTTDTIDVIVKSPHIDGYDLIAVDAGEITDQIERYNLMIDKLTTYMNYVTSDEFFSEYPDAAEKGIRLCVLCTEEPNEAMKNVEALKTRNEPIQRFEVLVTTQKNYLA
jgi:hypothetical protein